MNKNESELTHPYDICECGHILKKHKPAKNPEKTRCKFCNCKVIHIV